MWSVESVRGRKRLPGALCSLVLLCLALSACTARLTNPVTLANTPKNGINVPAEVRQGDNGSTLVVIQVLIHGKGPYPMAVDTGASLSLIDSSLADTLGLKAVSPPEDITGVGGVQRVTPVQINSWSAGKAQLPSISIGSAPLPDLRRSADVYGLLGSDLWSRFGAITVDYVDSQLTIYQINGATSARRLPSRAA